VEIVFRAASGEAVSNPAVACLAHRPAASPPQYQRSTNVYVTSSFEKPETKRIHPTYSSAIPIIADLIRVPMGSEEAKCCLLRRCEALVATASK
jgi:hypothetical protein